MNVTLATVDATISVETQLAATDVNASVVTSVRLGIRQSVLVSIVVVVVVVLGSSFDCGG